VCFCPTFLTAAFEQPQMVPLVGLVIPSTLYSETILLLYNLWQKAIRQQCNSSCSASGNGGGSNQNKRTSTKEQQHFCHATTRKALGNPCCEQHYKARHLPAADPLQSWHYLLLNSKAEASAGTS
jgi:hypothetical protein